MNPPKVESLDHPETEPGQALSLHEAIRESVRSRVRPIMMSMLTTTFGLLPLVLSSGSGSELYRGIGSVVLGGLVMSTMFTLFAVPALFSILMEWKYKREQRAEASLVPESSKA